MHPLLKRQLKKSLGTLDELSPELEALLEAVSQTYEQADLDHELLERALEMTSEELLVANDELRARHAALEAEVHSRTAELADASTELRVEVAERAAIEQALRESDQRYRALAEHSPTGIFHSDPQGKTLYVNKAWSDITGLSLEQALEDGWRDAIHPADRDFKVAEWNDAIKRQRPLRGRGYRVLRPDGSIVWVEGFAAPLLNDTGEILGYVGSIYDITSQKESEEIIRESEEKYRTLFEQSHDVIYISTVDGRFIDINPAGVELFGFKSREHLLNADLGRDLYVDPEERRQLVRRLMEEGSVHAVELHLKAQDDRPLTVLASINTVRDAKGDATAFRGILHDITATKQLERELRQSQKMEAIGRLAGGVAHDFNNLLTAVIGYADLISMTLPASSSLTRHAEEIKAVSKRGAALTNQLLSFSRRRALAPTIVSVNQSVADMNELLSRLIATDVELVTELEAEDDFIRADPTQLEQIIINLVINARDAMPEGGILRISTRSLDSERVLNTRHALSGKGPWIRLAVSDTGTGIPEEIQDQIFEPFFSTKDDSKGTGLGLSTVYGAVQQNGGSVYFSSQPGLGTTFEIFLPTVDDRPEVIDDETTPMADLHGSETVLVAEDEPAVRSLLTNLLLQQGYHVLAAENGEEALEIARSFDGTIDLLISDIVMPKLNGIDLARTLRKELPHVRIGLLTGYSQSETVLDSVCDFYLIKPFAPKVLALRARQILDRAPSHS
ncbi:MAG: PAS domain S-box protein [bacterium]|nr:PAS domain S-box protein [bacterium]